jgi:2-dehydropantoate 2-reductase
MPAITIIGPGAIGGLIAAHLARDDTNRVTIAARTPFSSLVLETDEGRTETAPQVLTEPEQAAPADWVLVATKAYDSESAAAWFARTLRADTRVAVLQNGVNHVERFAAWLPRERIVPVIVDCPTERLAPGHIRQRGPLTLTVPATPDGRAFTGLFARSGARCDALEDFTTMTWWKLCLNAAGVVNALTAQPAGIANNPLAAGLMRRIVDEAAAVGRAEGAKLAPDIADEVVGIYRNQPGDSVNSLLADRLAGRPLEIDLRNGVIVERGRRHGIPTPYNDMAVALLKLA